MPLRPACHMLDTCHVLSAVWSSLSCPGRAFPRSRFHSLFRLLRLAQQSLVRREKIAEREGKYQFFWQEKQESQSTASSIASLCSIPKTTSHIVLCSSRQSVPRSGSLRVAKELSNDVEVRQ